MSDKINVSNVYINLKSQIDALKSSVAGLGDIVSGLHGCRYDVLYSNNTSYEPYDEQTVNIPAANIHGTYDLLVIEFRVNTDFPGATRRCVAFCDPWQGVTAFDRSLSLMGGNTLVEYARMVTFASDGHGGRNATFSSGFELSNGTYTANSGVMVPYRIMGLKFISE